MSHSTGILSSSAPSTFGDRWRRKFFAVEFIAVLSKLSSLVYPPICQQPLLKDHHYSIIAAPVAFLWSRRKQQLNPKFTLQLAFLQPQNHISSNWRQNEGKDFAERGLCVGDVNFEVIWKFWRIFCRITGSLACFEYIFVNSYLMLQPDGFCCKGKSTLSCTTQGLLFLKKKSVGLNVSGKNGKTTFGSST